VISITRDPWTRRAHCVCVCEARCGARDVRQRQRPQWLSSQTDSLSLISQLPAAFGIKKLAWHIAIASVIGLESAALAGCLLCGRSSQAFLWCFHLYSIDARVVFNAIKRCWPNPVIRYSRIRWTIALVVDQSGINSSPMRGGYIIEVHFEIPLNKDCKLLSPI